NALALQALLQGAPGAYRDIVLLNAAAALVVAGRAQDLRTGAAVAARAIDSGAASSVLARLKEATSASPPPAAPAPRHERPPRPWPRLIARAAPPASPS